jgi:hypothetical protein
MRQALITFDKSPQRYQRGHEPDPRMSRVTPVRCNTLLGPPLLGTDYLSSPRSNNHCLSIVVTLSGSFHRRFSNAGSSRRELAVTSSLYLTRCDQVSACRMSADEAALKVTAGISHISKCRFGSELG